MKESAKKKGFQTALLTPFDTGNIGTVLQAYATQTLIQENGYQNDLIYFHYDAIQNPFLLSNLKKRGIKKYVGSIAGFLLRYPAQKNLWKFIHRHIRLTNPVSHTDLKKMAEIYDLIVVGSDCVWNGDAFELETAYLLDFVNDSNKKGNFASSFACDDIPAEQRPVFAKYLSLFPMLSVREKRGKELIQALTGKEAQVVLDPTLTRTSSFWKDIIQESRLKIEKEYIFVAEYAISSALMNDAIKMSKEKNLPIYCLYPPKGRKTIAKTFLRAAPEDVLYLLSHASYISPDSYHMMIFSINFNKEFFAYRTVTNIPAISKYDSILECLNLENRLFHTEKTSTNEIDITAMPPIEYGRVNQILKKERERSVQFLLTMLSEANRKSTKNDNRKSVRGGGALCESALFERTICLSGLTITAPKGAAA
nr:polysaccharide pyruvyl transferase family protein [Ruthenibacterium lactatiformans]